MISILRTEVPNHLNTAKRQLKSTDYKHDSVIAALLEMQHSKCCYCERKLTDLGQTERWVEHIKPQAEFKDSHGKIDWNKVNDWNNLLFSCATCNRKKGTTPFVDKESGKILLVEPSHPDINPEDHITFFVDGVLIGHLAVKGSAMGKLTVEKLFKGRVELYRAFKKIKSEIDACVANIARALAAKDKGELSVLNAQISQLTCSKIIHVGFIRAYLRIRIKEFNLVELPQINDHFGTDFDPIEVKITTGHECLT